MAQKNKLDTTSDRMATYLAKMDFKLLKSQKKTLNNLQAKKGKNFTQKDWDTIEGILNFIDSIQDIAVDEYGYDEKKVFNLSKKD